MADYCTCGAQLPPDALFCHKCGKPQRELVAVEMEPPPPPPEIVSVPPLLLEPQTLPLNFRNPVAVRIGLLVAVSATVLGFLPIVNWLAAGFFAVFFYRRKTGSLLNVGAGMRIGWITGILTFVLAAVIFTAQQLPAALSGQLANAIEQQMKTFSAQDPAAIQQMASFLHTGPGIASAMAFSLVGLFIFITFFTMAGGALAAKLVGGTMPASR